MFYSRNTNVKINKLHKRASRLVYDELLEKDNSLTLHHYNIQTLCIELCKVLVGSHKRYLVICSTGKILITTCFHSLILLIRRFKLFIKDQIHFDTLDLLYGV